jgi:hypothetical protein
MEGVPNWKLNSENQHTFNGISEKTDNPKMSTVKNPTFIFDLTQIQVVSFQCNQFFLYETTRTSNMGLTLS